jgi:hypothetical protein
MAFPTSPTNGQITVVNNVSYQYSNVSNAWTRILSTANLITANTIASNGNISAAGNIITGNYFIGNGSLLTGISTNPAAITNGTSNVSVVSSGGNVTVGIGGTGNVAIFATSGEYITGLLSVGGNVTGGNILTAGAISATGTLSVTGATTLGTTSTGNLSASNVTTGGIMSSTGNATHGNILTGGILSATGTINSDANIIAGTNTKASPAIFYTNTANSQYGALLMQKAGVERWLIGSDNSTGNGNVVIRFNATTNYVTVTETGGVSITGNVTSGNLLTGGLLSATGNVTGGNLLTGGLVSAAGTITGTSHLGAVLSVTANVTGGNILTGGLISSTGNVVSAGNIIAGKIVSATDSIVVTSTGGEGGQIILGWTGIGNITGQANSTWNLDVDSSNNWRAFYQNAAGAAQVLITANSTSNIVSFPQSAGVSATGNIAGGNLTTVGQISATGNISGNYYIGNGAFLTGLQAGATSSLANGATSVTIPVASGNIAMNVGGASNTVVINLGSLTMYGSFAGPKTLSANVSVASGVNALLLGPVTIGNGYNINVPSDSTLSTYGDASPDIVGSTLTIIGNITGGNLLTSGLISATSTITSSANITGGNLRTSGLISATGNITGNNIFTSGDILPTANATANIGSSSFQYNTIFAKATSAQYADLAENYEADANYEPGTVVCFGGAKEVTVCNLADCTSVAGVVSNNPSYLMNSGQTGEYVAAVALQGRVPTKVTGQIRKGDLIVSAGNGRGQANNNARAGTIIGKALANSEGNAVIEVVVGRD